MKKLLFLYTLLLTIFSIKVTGQISVTRTPSLNFTTCQPQIITYQVGISTGTYGQIDMVEDFSVTGCNNCFTIVASGPLPSGVTVNNTTKTVSLTRAPATYSSTLNFTFSVRITANQSGDFSSCRVCSNGPQVTCTTPTSINASPNVQECITLTTTNKWNSHIRNNCVVQTGLNCYRYPIRLFGNGCDGMNLSGQAWFDFTVPVGGVISGVSSASGNHTISNVGITGNTVRFRSNPSGGIYYKNQSGYYINVDVQYPCATFPANNVTPVTATLSNSLITWPPTNGLTIMPTCPTSVIPIGGESIQGTSITHTLDRLETDAELVIGRAYTQGHDAAGCSNRYDIQLCNKGNTILENIVITADPLPPSIRLTQACGTTITAFRVNGGPWQNGIPTGSILSQVTGVRWNTPDVHPGPQCDTLPRRRCPTPVRLCYEILPGTSVGTNIDACVSATFDQRVDCRATGCNQQVPGPNFPLPLPACHDFDVTTDQAVPGIGKSVSPNSGFPGQTLNFSITVSNCGSGNLITQIRDNFPTALTNVSITGYQRYVNGAWQTGPGSWLTSPATISGNNVSVDVDIPGTCSSIPHSTRCCISECNYFRVNLQAEISPCEQAGTKINTARLSPQTSFSHTAYFTVKKLQPTGHEKRSKRRHQSQLCF